MGATRSYRAISAECGEFETLRVRDRDVAWMAERLEHVEVVVAAGRVPTPEARSDVMDLEAPRPRAASLARPAVSRERARTRMTPEVVVDEVGTARVAAPSPPPGWQGPATPRARVRGLSVGLAARKEQAGDLGHTASPKDAAAQNRARTTLAADRRRASP